MPKLPKIQRLYIGKKLNEKIEFNLGRAGIKKTPQQFILRFIIIAFFLSILGVILLWDSIAGYSGARFFLTLLSYWLLSLVGSLLFSLFLMYTYVSYKKYQRRMKLEEVLSDYLQLVAANVGAGLPIDQSLWYAIRERFGVLAEEMEIVAKKTMIGFDLNEALLELTKKYDSKVLERSVTVLIEGLDAGGEVSSLISKISWNIKENQLMQKEIAADVTTYAIFIIFASLIIAPILFALSHRIIVVIGNIMSQIDLSNVGSMGTKLPITNIGQGISAADFRIFALISIIVGSFFSAITVAAVKTGSEKSGFKYLLIYLGVALAIFFLTSLLLTSLFGDIGLT